MAFPGLIQVNVSRMAYAVSSHALSLALFCPTKPVMPQGA